MAVERLIAVLPCYGLEDITKDLSPAQIRSFHACWTSLWHPRLLSLAGSIPEWKRADTAALDIEKAIVLVPNPPPPAIDTTLIERLIVQHCTVVTGGDDRTTTLAAIESACNDGESIIVANSLTAKNELTIEPEATAKSLHGDQKTTILADDFYSLGLAMLLVQALTRKIHYSSNLDVVLFAEQSTKAANAFIDRASIECERWLQACFDQLSQERDRYFSQTAHLIDLTLIAKSTLKSSLDRQLERKHSQNLLLPHQCLTKLQSTNPSALATIVQLTEEKTMTVTGDSGGTDFLWMQEDNALQKLRLVKSEYVQHGLPAPEIYADAQTGLTTDMPRLLVGAGYRGVVLRAFSSDRQYPSVTQAKIRWESNDSSAIDAIASGFVDASEDSCVYSIVSDLGKQFDYHQIPTLTFVHWPDRTSQAFDDLVRATRRTSALGNWSTLDHYFSSTGQPYATHKFDHAQNLRFPLDFPSTRAEYASRAARCKAETVQQSSHRDAALIQMVLNAIVQPMTESSEPFPETNAVEQNGSLAAIDEIIKVIPRTKANVEGTEGKVESVIAINPMSGPRRIYLESDGATLTCDDPQRIYAECWNGAQQQLAIDLPGCSAVQLQSCKPSTIQTVTASQTARSLNPLRKSSIGSRQWLMANEFIECQVDPTNGYLRSLKIARHRGGKLSGMPAIRLKERENASKHFYAVPCNVTLEYASNTPLRSLIRARGNLGFEGRIYANFSCEYELWTGSRSLAIDISVAASENHRWNAEDHVWDSAPIWRTVWPSPTTIGSTWIHGVKKKLTGKEWFAPELIELDDAEHRITIATIGAPLHRRIESNYLDTLLPSTDQTCHHQMKVAVDWQRPVQQVLESLSNSLGSYTYLFDDIGTHAGSPFRNGASQWLLQVDQANVVATGCGRQQLEIRETSNRSTTCRISLFRPIVGAFRIGNDNTRGDALTISQGDVVVKLEPSQRLRIGFEL